MLRLEGTSGGPWDVIIPQGVVFGNDSSSISNMPLVVMLRETLNPSTAGDSTPQAKSSWAALQPSFIELAFTQVWEVHISTCVNPNSVHPRLWTIFSGSAQCILEVNHPYHSLRWNTKPHWCTDPVLGPLRRTVRPWPSLLQPALQTTVDCNCTWS